MSLEDGFPEASPFLDYLRNAPATPLRNRVWLSQQKPVPILVAERSSDFTQEFHSSTRESDAAASRRWEEYCDDGLRERLQKKGPLKRFLTRLKENFPGMVKEIVRTAACGVCNAGFLWGNLGGGMFSYTYYKTAQEKRKEG